MKLGIVSPGRTSSGGSAFSQGLVEALERLLGQHVVSSAISPIGTFRPDPELASCSHVVFIGARAERLPNATSIFWPLNVAPLEKHVARVEASSLKHRVRHLALLQRLRHSVDVASGMIFGSMHARALYQAELPAAASKPYTISKGGAPSLAPIPRVTGTDPLVLLVSHLYPYKGILQFVEATALASTQLPGSVRFRIAGADGDARYAEAVRRRIRELGIENRIEVRRADPVEMARLYSEATVCVFTSTCENAGSFALYDGLHAGVPTICSDRSSMPEMVGDVVRLVNPYAPKAVAEEIVSLMSDEDSRAELSEASLRWAKLAPTWDRRAAEVVDFIGRTEW